MAISWVAASVRARLISRRRVGRVGAGALAASEGLGPALETLSASPYGHHVEAGMSLEEAQRAVAAATLWNLRVLAGWLPHGATGIAQPLIGWFELANLEDRLASFAGAGCPQPFELGRLALAWPDAARAASVEGIRAALAASRWGDPGTSDPAGMMLVLRFRLASRVAASVPGASGWAAAGSALLAARLLGADRTEVVHPYGLPESWRQAGGIADLAVLLPPEAARILEGVDAPEDLWRAEARWWARLGHGGRELMVSAAGPRVIVGAAALMAHDAWLVRAALAAAAAGGGTLEAFHAVA